MSEMFDAVLIARSDPLRALEARSDVLFRLLARTDVLLARAARADAQAFLNAVQQTSFFLKAGPLMSVTSNLTFFRGEDVTLNFQMTPPVDVTGWNITFTVMDVLGGTTQFSHTATIVDGPRGQWSVAIASADTASLPVGRYVWDARRTDSGNRSTLADGYIDLRQEVTP